MKKFILVLVVISLVSFSCVLPIFSIAPIANPTDTSESFTKEEMQALFLSSKCNYVVHWFDDTTSSGSVTPFIRNLDNAGWDTPVFLYLPIPNLGSKVFDSISIIWELPFTVKNCVTLDYAVAPFSILSNGTSNPPYMGVDYSLTYQFDNANAPLGEQVVYSSTFTCPTTVNPRSQLMFTNGQYGDFHSNYAQFAYINVNNTLTGITLGSLSAQTVTNTFVLNSDITSLGWTYNKNGIDGYSYNWLGLGFAVKPIRIVYESGGGYNPSPTDPDDPDNPSGGDYSQKLDEIYNELVRQGQIQEVQNNEIIKGQQDIKDSIDSGFADIKDTLVTTSPEQNSQISENSSVIASQSDSISSMAQEIDDFNSSVGGGGHKADAHSGAGHIASATDDIDFDNPSSIWSIIGSFFEGHGGLLITIAVFTWLFVLFKIILYGVHS